MEPFEADLHSDGVQPVAGLDEVGRGALFGPVVAAAVILPPEAPLEDVRDSKQLSARQRVACFEQIQEHAIDWSIGWASAAEIDDINILEATRLAMRRALAGLEVRPRHLLIDALEIDEVSIPQTAIVRGDARCRSIAAASIVAKIARDAIVRACGRSVRGYGLRRNMGYATAEHRGAILENGFSELHRRSFRVQGKLPFGG